MIGLGADLGLATLPAVTAIARETLGWSAERAAAEAGAYIAATARYLDPAAVSAR
jgi:hypothetical protein